MNTTVQRSVRESRERALSTLTASPFIGNIVASFIGLNRAGEKDRLDSALAQFGGLFSYLSETSEKTNLAEELCFVEKYLGIQKMRFGDRFEYTIRTDGLSSPIRRFALFETVERIVGKTLEIRSGTIEIRIACSSAPGNAPPSARIRVSSGGSVTADEKWTLEP
jgi:LytS/YehU family sensor histidine kinase